MLPTAHNITTISVLMDAFGESGLVEPSVFFLHFPWKDLWVGTDFTTGQMQFLTEFTKTTTVLKTMV